MSDVICNISSGFYDSVNGDRLYSAADMNKPYKRVIADGIFPTPQGTPSTDFQVVAVSGMSVAVLAGNAMIGARWAENTDDVGITIAGNSSSSPRIDSIFLHIDTGMDTRAAGVVYRQGTAAGTPTAPAMVRTDNITELRLADILVAPSAAIITQANITDQRGGSDCPWVAGLIQQVDTSALFDQYRAAYAEQQQEQSGEWRTFMDHLARDYDISMSLRKHESTYTSTAAASLIPIQIDGYDTTHDLLQVFINGVFAIEGTHYIIKNAAQIQLTNAISSGQNVHFVVYKAVMGGAQPIIPTDEQVQAAVDDYMDAHPGALVVDPELSDTSTHAIQNKAVAEAVTELNVRLAQLDTIVGNEVTESTAFDFSEEEYSAGAIVNSLNVINIPLTNCTIKTITFVMNTSKALDCMIYVIKSDMTVVKSIEGTSESAGLSHTVSIDYAIPDNGTYYVGIYIDTARAITYGPAQEDVQTNCYEFDPTTLIIGELTKADKRRVRASLLIETVGKNKITVLESDVDGLDERVTALESRAEETLPAYYDEYLPGKIATLLSLDAEVGSHGDSFVFMTDYHDASNTGYSPELIKHIIENTATKMIVFGGDIINQYATKEEAYPHFADFHKRFLFSNAYYPIIGNHEYNDPGNQDTGYTGKRMTNSEAYGMNLRQKEVDTRYQWDGGYTYHVDNTAQKIRYYMIGCNPSSTIEAESRNAFFISLESVPANYTVIVIAHQLASYNSGNPVYGTAGQLIANGCDAYNARETFTANSLSHDYSGATGKIVLLMQGHTHIDFDILTTDGIHSVSTTCDSYAQQIGSLVRTAGTVTEQAFEVVHVNTDSKTIKLTRIGAGTDRQFTYA